MSGMLPSVLVLAGGPDAEHPVSLQSAAAVAEALREAGAEVHHEVVGRPTAGELSAMPGEVVFPVLHGAFGEGGPLQDLLDAVGRPYVGCRGMAARAAMDKLGTKLVAASLGIATKRACVLDVRDGACPYEPPVVIKPVQDGSSVGLHMCADGGAWARAHAEVSRDIAAQPGRVYMIEPMVRGRELTVPLLGEADGLHALPVIEIAPASGVYDYAAKYDRDDTRYIVNPGLPRELLEYCAKCSLRLAGALGVRHLARVDYMLDERGEPWLLEVNTMPGFTSHSLLPMAAKAAGRGMGELCAHLVRLAAHADVAAAQH